MWHTGVSSLSFIIFAFTEELMRRYTLDEARRTVLNCAKLYENNLCGRSYIVIYRDRSDYQIKAIEVLFLPENYQHLTGIELIDEDGNRRDHVADLFYKKCINNTLSKTEIRFKQDGTTPLKLEALPIIMTIHKVTKIAGDYNNGRPFLVADKLIGNVNFCMGLKKIGDIYFPASALMENIKYLTNAQSQVLAVMSKEVGASIYKDIRHVAKGLDLTKLEMPYDINAKISLKAYKKR